MKNIKDVICDGGSCGPAGGDCNPILNIGSVIITSVIETLTEKNDEKESSKKTNKKNNK